MAEEHEMSNTTRAQSSSLDSNHLLEDQDTSSRHERSRKLDVELHQDFHRTRTHPLLQGFWWLLTLILCVLCMVTIKIYVLKGSLSSGQKNAFNTIITGLILGLGLNFFEVFKSFAKASRGWILARPDLTDRERELIEEIENITNVCVLGWQSRRKWGILLVCIAWIFINILAQVAVAVVSLTFSVEDGQNWRNVYVRPGIANATNLTCYFDSFNGRGCGSNVTIQALAHAYGDLALSSKCGPYTKTSDILNSNHDYRYYCRRTPHQQEFAIRFNEYNPNDQAKAYPRFTNRIITASSGECHTYSMVGNPRGTGNGDLLYTYTNGTFQDNITIPAQSQAFDGTTYIYRGVKTPQEASKYACGKRCIKMWAHKSAGHGENSTFYECPVTVKTVSNTTNATQTVSNDMARIAAASIALQGRPEGNPENETIWTQYQLYASGSAYDVHSLRADEVGANMSEFAIGSLATMAYTNPPILVDGLVPHLGSRLMVQWYYAIPLLVGIAGVHLAIFVSSIYMTRMNRTVGGHPSR